MLKRKIAISLLSTSLLVFSASCAKSFEDEEICATCSERDLNAPVDGSVPQEEAPILNPPTGEGGQGTTRDYSYVDPNNLIAEKPLELALKYYDANYDKIVNKNYVVVIDFTQHASVQRLYLIDMKTGAVTKMLTSVGKGSDPDGDGTVNSFGNVPESGKSSVGYYITGTTYQGGNGLSLRLHGMSSTNSNAYSRLIVVHGANYVKESDQWAGRSQGCPAVDHSLLPGLVAKIKGGALMYIWHPNYSLER